MGETRLPPGWPLRHIDLSIGGMDLSLELPDEPYSLLDLPAVEDAFERDEYMPYWAHLWPAAMMLAAFLADRSDSADLPAPPAETLEIGCGLGVTGLVAAGLGYRATLSDYDPDALEFVRRNAGRNKLSIRTARIDWRNPPLDRYALVLGADVLYENRNHQPILEFLRLSVAPGGAALLADPGRRNADAFIHDAPAAGWRVDLHATRWESTAGRIIVLRRQCSA